MAKASSKPLQPNPFTTYRDPETGLWIIVKDAILKTENQAQKREEKVENDCPNP